VAYIKLTEEIVKQHNVTMSEATSMVNELSALEDCPVWVLMAEFKEDNNVRCRLRSKGPAINELANKYNGGGHKLACGATIDSWETADKLLADMDQLAKEYKKTV